jgi:squalene-hopene/tetraprenyl-beta-curcumene cyclase
MSLELAIQRTAEHLQSLRHAEGHWEGELSSSALSTATAIVALQVIDPVQHVAYIQAGTAWLVNHQNTDGGWGDTACSLSNLSTTLLCWSALRLTAEKSEKPAPAVLHGSAWVEANVGSLEPNAIAQAVVSRYGKDKTFSVPILMHCALCGTLGAQPWRHVLALPYELAALPREWFGLIGLPVVSYALPALIAIGRAHYKQAAPAWWNPLRWLRALAWNRVRPMLRDLQPSTGGYLEATPLTSFVSMALAAAGELDHPCLGPAVSFLRASMRSDGSWPIDSNLSTWATTLAIKALCAPGSAGIAEEQRKHLQQWLLKQQYQQVHPFTNSAPGGWAWTPLPGGVPDADDTSGALIALHELAQSTEQKAAFKQQATAAVQWLLGLQNRDGGVPTFCRGWGALPFDRSSAEISSHVLRAWQLWAADLTHHQRQRALAYLRHSRRADHSWEPLWFGNEHAPEQMNLVYGTAQVLIGLIEIAEHELVPESLDWLLQQQHADGSWGGTAVENSSIEETAVALEVVSRAYCAGLLQDLAPIQKAILALLHKTQQGTAFKPSPIGLYFARLWYHEQLYPVIWSLSAFAWAHTALSRQKGLNC